MKRITVEVNDDLHRQVKLMSVNLQMTIADVVRELIFHEFKQQQLGKGRFKVYDGNSTRPLQ